MADPNQYDTSGLSQDQQSQLNQFLAQNPGDMGRAGSVSGFNISKVAAGSPSSMPAAQSASPANSGLQTSLLSNFLAQQDPSGNGSPLSGLANGGAMLASSGGVGAPASSGNQTIYGTSNIPLSSYMQNPQAYQNPGISALGSGNLQGQISGIGNMGYASPVGAVAPGLGRGLGGALSSLLGGGNNSGQSTPGLAGFFGNSPMAGAALNTQNGIPTPGNIPPGYASGFGMSPSQNSWQGGMNSSLPQLIQMLRNANPNGPPTVNASPAGTGGVDPSNLGMM